MSILSDPINEMSFEVSLPSALLLNKNIDPACIKLFAFIKSLTRAHGYCFASNKYLANLMGSCERSIKNYLKSLRDNEYIDVEFETADKQCQRRIFIGCKLDKKWGEAKRCLGVGKTMPGGGQNFACISIDSSISKIEEEPPIVPLKVDECVSFGKFVKLKKKEHADLIAQYGDKSVRDMIAQMNDHFAATGKKPYSDFAAALRNWFRRRQDEKPNAAKPMNRIDEDKALADKISKKFPAHPNISIGYNYIEFKMHRMGIPDPHIIFGDNGFQEQVENCLRKMDLKL